MEFCSAFPIFEICRQNLCEARSLIKYLFVKRNARTDSIDIIQRKFSWYSLKFVITGVCTYMCASVCVFTQNLMRYSSLSIIRGVKRYVILYTFVHPDPLGRSRYFQLKKSPRKKNWNDGKQKLEKQRCFCGQKSKVASEPNTEELFDSRYIDIYRFY